ncbi:hypothetical protein [Arthrobacter sp. N1]|uniref:hypothetical protein n=1 Tax=Arthrobacter sp. N1 TaxID=619291 RepID=UPI003BAFD413
MEELARSGKGNPEVSRRLIAELELRKSPRARLLKSQLENQDQSRLDGAPVRSRTRNTSRPAPLPPAKPTQEVTVNAVFPTVPSPAGEDEALLRKYESLRATFTVEAELLARWGMTAALPRDMQELMFKEWCKRLQSGPDEVGRSADALAEDRLRIAHERDALRSATKPPRVVPALSNFGRATLGGKER